jgi:general L-amino acid transport system permease protein
MAVEALSSTPRVKVAPWNDPVIRGWVFQIVVVGSACSPGTCLNN